MSAGQQSEVGLSSPFSAPSGDVTRWIGEARAGSPEALGRLLEACRNYLLLIANDALQREVQSKAGASDMVQETFLQAQQHFERFAGSTEEELLGWLRRILLNHVANFTRRFRGTDKRDVGRELALDDTPVGGLRLPGETPSGEVVAREDDAALQNALARLPEHYRQVIEWRNFEELPFDEIGRRLDRSAAAARKLWVRALEELKKLLGPLNDSF